MLNSFALASKQFSKVLICSDIISFQSSDPKHLALIFFSLLASHLKGYHCPLESYCMLRLCKHTKSGCCVHAPIKRANLSALVLSLLNSVYQLLQNAKYAICIIAGVTVAAFSVTP